MKYDAACGDGDGGVVAPHWGAWIEIAMPPRERVARNRRTPLGCVD